MKPAPSTRSHVHRNAGAADPAGRATPFRIRPRPTSRRASRRPRSAGPVRTASACSTSRDGPSANRGRRDHPIQPRRRARAIMGSYLDRTRPSPTSTAVDSRWPTAAMRCSTCGPSSLRSLLLWPDGVGPGALGTDAADQARQLVRLPVRQGRSPEQHLPRLHDVTLVDWHSFAAMNGKFALQLPTPWATPDRSQPRRAALHG